MSAATASRRALAVLVAMALVAAGVVVAGATVAPDRKVTPALQAAVTGNLWLDNSLAGEPVLVARQLAPGRVRRGEVVVRNITGRPVRVRLVARGLTDHLGPGGGALSRALRLRVKRIRPYVPYGSNRDVLYDGALRRLGMLRLGRWRRGESRTYRMRISFRDGGRPPSTLSGDNAYQGSLTTIDFAWKARR